MDSYLVNGKNPLNGSVSIHGAKNSVLPILAGTILVKGKSVIRNCPNLSDVFATARILEHLGCVVSWEDSVMTVDATDITETKIPESLMQEMRSSVLFLGALIARTGEATISCPGGCELGPRPIDLHVKSLKRLGVTFEEDGDNIRCKARQMYGRKIMLDFPSVGATENAMLAACSAKGNTIICNAAREPEIVDLQGFLRSMGAKVWGAGSNTILIEGGHLLHAGEYSVMPDRIVTATYMSAVAAATGEVELIGGDLQTIAPVAATLIEAGCQIQSDRKKICIESKFPLKGVRPIYTAPYPGFPTDAQPIVMSALACGVGSTVFIESIFTNRYSQVDSLRRMGAAIQVDGKKAHVNGNPFLKGAQLEAYDLRGGAALIVAALSAEGESEITGLQFIDRGYEKLEENLQFLGADIKRIKSEAEVNALFDLDVVKALGG